MGIHDKPESGEIAKSLLEIHQSRRIVSRSKNRFTQYHKPKHVGQPSMDMTIMESKKAEGASTPGLFVQYMEVQKPLRTVKPNVLG
ncbi:MAG: hypothetical protein Pars92KO_02950 [Parasphingorhabdus sp.]